jgi:predicted aldo/keto reductase-like oxidoreductase
MERVRLGRTNLTVTKLGWGGIPIQRVSEPDAVSVIGSVVDMGVDFLDTARSYTNSEYRIGLALQKIKRPVILSSKSLVRTEKIYEDVHLSLKQLNVKKIDIYHLHAVSHMGDYEKVMGSGGAYRGLKRALDEGLIGHIGISSHSLEVLEKAIQEGYFDVVMVCYSFLEPNAAKRIFPLAKTNDVGVITMKPFSGGVIEEAGPALRFVLSTPDIVPIPGSETLEMALENWEVFKKGVFLTQSDWDRIEALRREFDHEFCRRCDYCQPCSEKISIQHVLGLKYIIKRFGPQTQELPWVMSLIEKARNCSECGDCLSRCPYQLPIPELVKTNLAWYDNLGRLEEGHRRE